MKSLEGKVKDAAAGAIPTPAPTPYPAGESAETPITTYISYISFAIAVLPVLHWICSYFCCLPFYVEELILTDRRLIKSNFVTQGQLGTSKSGKYRQVTKSWLIRHLRGAEYTKVNAFWTDWFSCLAQCIKGAKVVQSMAVGISGQHNWLQFHFAEHYSHEKVQSFFADLLHCQGFEQQLGHVEPLDPKAITTNLLMMSDEKVLTDISVIDKGIPMWKKVQEVRA